MDTKLEFKNGLCLLVITPSDEWEQKLLSAVAKGGDSLEADVIYSSEGHFTYGNCKAVKITLFAKGTAEIAAFKQEAK
jgi:hypothetical protein